MSNRITRREFSAGLAAMGVAAATKRSALGVLGANEKVNIGFIGVGNRGDQLLDAFLAQPDARITAICDVYEPYLEFARKKVGGDPYLTGDYREVLKRKDVDAVVIATPDHWHALQFIDACAAGKDVYVEKPLSLTILEGRKMVQAANRHNRITQVGTHRRSIPMCKELVKLIHDGAIGKVTSCRAYRIRNEWPMGIGKPADTKPPKGLDWDMWLGPAPEARYNENRCLYKFRWFRPYSGGQLTNFGTHYLDMIQWALRQDAPAGACAMGGRYAVDDNREIPDTLEAMWEYPGGALVTFTTYDANGAPGLPNNAQLEYRGTKGTIYVGWNSAQIVPSAIRTAPIPPNDPTDRAGTIEQLNRTEEACEARTLKGGTGDEPHVRDFLDGVKTRRPCSCPVEVGHRSTSATLLAGMAFDRRRYLLWDSEAERVTNDPEANALLSYEYRKPWKLPD